MAGQLCRQVETFAPAGHAQAVKFMLNPSPLVARARAVEVESHRLAGVIEYRPAPAHAAPRQVVRNAWPPSTALGVEVCPAALSIVTESADHRPLLARSPRVPFRLVT